MSPPVPKPVRLWPREAIGPLGNKAMFQCAGDIPAGWTLVVPLPGEFVPLTPEDDGMRHPLDPPKRGPGRPPKDKSAE